MATEAKTDNAADSGGRHTSTGWRLFQMTFRGLARISILALLVIIPYCQMNPRKEFDVSVVTDFGSYELSADHTGCLLQCRFRPNVAWDFYRLDLNERWNLTRPPRVSEYVASLKSQLQVRQPGVWGLVGFGTGLAWVSQSSQLVASLNHTWTIYLALLAFWFVDGRRTTRWFRQQRSTIETPDA
ncbi:MAG: hypothetical protein ABGZ35_09090 [Planctomycetaceae bacterium]|jgi:hypothetical protein